MSSSLAEMDELRELRSNIRRGVNSLEVCWACGVVCEGSAWKLSGRQQVWLCEKCREEQAARAATVTSKALLAGSQ